MSPCCCCYYYDINGTISTHHGTQSIDDDGGVVLFASESSGILYHEEYPHGMAFHEQQPVPERESQVIHNPREARDIGAGICTCLTLVTYSYAMTRCRFRQKAQHASLM